MRDRRMGRGIIVCAMLSAFYGAADAQTSAVQGSNVPAQRQLSPQEQLAQADAIVTRMNASGANVRRMLEQARAQRDVVKTLCLNDKLNQIDVAGRSGQDRKNALEQALTRKDADLANHELTILTVLKQRVEQLVAEANQCIGEEAGFFPETKVTMTVDPSVPTEDPSSYPENVIISPVPPCASCVK